MSRAFKIAAAVCFAVAVIGLDVSINIVALGLLLFTVGELV